MFDKLNINNNDAQQISDKINEMFSMIYRKRVPLTQKYEIDEISITYPRGKIDKGNLKYLKHKRKLIGNILLNINKKPFVDIKANIYAFEALWMILTILDDNTRDNLKQKGVFTDVLVAKNMSNKIMFGKYIIKIPKLKKTYIFDVQGYNLAKLNIV